MVLSIYIFLLYISLCVCVCVCVGGGRCGMKNKDVPNDTVNLYISGKAPFLIKKYCFYSLHQKKTKKQHIL